MKNKGGFEFSFGWIFAIIVGAAIIFLAVYASSKFVFTERQITDSETAQRLGTLLNPLETSIEDGLTSSIEFPTEARVYNGCNNLGSFGAQKISVATKSGIGSAWQSPGINTTIYNRYIFSEGVAEGKEFSVFSKPIEMPFKIADLIFLWGDKERYCFTGQSSQIEDEIRAIKPKNLVLENSTNECDAESDRIVCFNSPRNVRSSDCYANVDEVNKKVTKKGQTVFYEGSLIYGAIFADSSLYECQVKRLMKRASEISMLFLTKSIYASSRNNGCGSVLQPLLSNYANLTSASDSSELRELEVFSERLKEANDAITCKIF